MRKTVSRPSAVSRTSAAPPPPPPPNKLKNSIVLPALSTSTRRAPLRACLRGLAGCALAPAERRDARRGRGDRAEARKAAEHGGRSPPSPEPPDPNTNASPWSVQGEVLARAAGRQLRGRREHVARHGTSSWQELAARGAGSRSGLRAGGGSSRGGSGAVSITTGRIGRRGRRLRLRCRRRRVGGGSAPAPGSGGAGGSGGGCGVGGGSTVPPPVSAAAAGPASWPKSCRRPRDARRDAHGGDEERANQVARRSRHSLRGLQALGRELKPTREDLHLFVHCYGEDVRVEDPEPRGGK